MARLWGVGFELDTISGTNQEYALNAGSGGNWSIVTSPTDTGGYAMKMSATATYSIGTAQIVETATGTLYAQAAIYVNSSDGWPSTNTEILSFSNSSSADTGALYMTNGGQIGLASEGTYYSGSGLSTALSFNTWYYVELEVNTTTANSQVITGRVNGIQFATNTATFTMVANSNYFINWGLSIYGSVTGTIYFDDLIVNDTTGSSMNSWVGGQNHLARFTPSGPGDSTQWSIGGTSPAATNWQSVSETVPDGNTTYTITSSSGKTDFFIVSGPSIPAGAVINCVMVGMYYAATTSPPTFKMQIKKTSGGTITSSSTLTPPGTTYKFNNDGSSFDYSLVLYQDPDGDAWNIDSVASMQIGYTSTSAPGGSTVMTTVWAYVDYTPLSENKFYLLNTTTIPHPSALDTGTKSTHLPAGTDHSPAATTALDMGKSPGTAQATITSTTGTTAVLTSARAHTWVSKPLAAQTISAQTWTLAFAGIENNTAANYALACSIYVIESGGTVRGYIYDAATQLGTKFTTSEQGRVVTVSGGSVTASSGDQLAIEVWGTGTQTGTTSRTITYDWNGTTDPVNATAASSAASYLSVPNFVQFSDSPPSTPTLITPPTAGVASLNPTLEFSTTDPDSDQIVYEVQIDTVNTFNSQEVLSDTFSGSSVNSAIWGIYTANSYVTVTEGSGVLTITPTVSQITQGQIYSNDTFTLSGNSAQVQVVQVAAGTTVDTALYLYYDDNNWLQIYQENGSLYPDYGVGGVETTGTPVTYNSSTMAYWRIRETAGTTYWEYSANASTWTTLQSLTNPLGVDGFVMELVVDEYAADSGAGAAEFDNAIWYGPLIDGVSSSTSGFSDITVPADSSPFPSGNTIGYTVQSSDTLTSGTTYYWQVRAIDPSGSDTYSSWSATGNFVAYGTALYLLNTTTISHPSALDTGTKSTALPAGTDHSPTASTALDIGSVPGATQTSTTSTTGTTAVLTSARVHTWVSEPLGGQSISAQNWTVGFAFTENNAAANQFMALSIYVIKSSGTVLGYVYDSATQLGTEFTTTEQGRVSTVSGSAVTGIATTDQLAVEVWSSGTQTGTTSRTVTYYWDGTTLPINTTAATSSASYITAASQNIFAPNNPPNAPTLSSPSNAGTVTTITPTLAFSGTDPDSDNLTYELQIDTVNTFNSQTDLATPAFVQQTGNLDNTGSVGTVSAAFVVGNTAGNMLYAVISQNASAAHITSFGDTQGNTWTQIYQHTDTSPNTTTVYVAYSCAGGNNTVSFSDGGYASGMVIGEVSGLATSSAYDTDAVNENQASTSLSVGATGTLAESDEFVLAVFVTTSSGAGWKNGSGYSSGQAESGTYNNLFVENKVVSSTAGVSAAATVSSSTNASGYLFTFKAASSSGPLIDTSSALSAPIVQTVANNNTSAGASTVTATLANVQAGDTIVVVVTTNTSADTVSTVADGTNTYNLITSNSPGYFYAAYNVAAASSLTITATMSVSNVAVIMAREYSGLTSAPMDKNTFATTTSTTPNSGSTGTTSQANELIFGWDASHSTGAPSLGTGFGHLATEYDGSSVDVIGFEDMLVTQTGTYAATFTVGASNPWITGIATFKLANTSNFSDVTNSGDASPFPSGDTINYVVPAGQALTNNTTYYWRVRAIDPNGSNTYGSWSSTDSFTVQTNSPPNAPTLSSPSNGGTVSSLVPVLDFSDTDPNGDAITYELQLDTTNTFNSQGGLTLLTSSYTENQTTTMSSLLPDKFAQIFYNTSADTLSSADWYIASTGSPSGNIVACLYAISGTPGTSGIPTGTALATSNTVSASGVSSTPGLVSFTFSGANQYAMAAATWYALSIEYSGPSGIKTYQQTSSSYSGNTADFISTWNPQASDSQYFDIYVSTPSVPLIDALSTSGGHDAADFADVTNSGDSDPFPSGDNMSFTVPSAEKLSVATTYYWRVRGKDPSGTDTFGSWSSTYDFTTPGLSGRLVSIGFELDSLTAGVEITGHNLSGTVASTISTAQVHSGTYSALFAVSSTGASNDYIQYISSGIGTLYARVYFYFTGYPSANCTIMESGNSSTSVGGAYMNSSGKIGVVYRVGSTTTYGTTLSSAVALNAWHYVEIEVVATTANSQTVTVRLDGTSIDTESGTETFAANAQTWLVWGAFCISSTESGTIASMYVDDIVVNTADFGSTQNSWAGAGNLALVRPDAAGDSNTFGTQVGGTAGSANNYTRVDEVTPDNATSYNASNTASTSDLFAVGSSGISGSAVINAVQVGAVFANITAADAATAIEFQIEQSSSGTLYNSAAIIPNSTTWVTDSPTTTVGYPITLPVDPTNTAWNTTTIGSMQVGYKLVVAGTNAIGVSTLWVYIDYASGTVKPNLMIFFP